MRDVRDFYPVKGRRCESGSTCIDCIELFRTELFGEDRKVRPKDG